MRTIPTPILPAQREAREEARRLEETVITTLPVLAAEEGLIGKTLPAQREAPEQALTAGEEEGTTLIVQEAAEIQDIVTVEKDIIEEADAESKISQFFIKKAELRLRLLLAEAQQLQHNAPILKFRF